MMSPAPLERTILDALIRDKNLALALLAQRDVPLLEALSYLPFHAFTRVSTPAAGAADPSLLLRARPPMHRLEFILQWNPDPWYPVRIDDGFSVSLSAKSCSSQLTVNCSRETASSIIKLLVGSRLAELKHLVVEAYVMLDKLGGLIDCLKDARNLETLRVRFLWHGGKGPGTDVNWRVQEVRLPRLHSVYLEFTGKGDGVPTEALHSLLLAHSGQLRSVRLQGPLVALLDACRSDLQHLELWDVQRDPGVVGRLRRMQGLEHLSIVIGCDGLQDDRHAAPPRQVRAELVDVLSTWAGPLQRLELVGFGVEGLLALGGGSLAGLEHLVVVQYMFSPLGEALLEHVGTVGTALVRLPRLRSLAFRGLRAAEMPEVLRAIHAAGPAAIPALELLILDYDCNLIDILCRRNAGLTDCEDGGVTPLVPLAEDLVRRSPSATLHVAFLRDLEQSPIFLRHSVSATGCPSCAAADAFVAAHNRGRVCGTHHWRKVRVS
ncbi:uncharacterized protein LOC113206743 [Frankliniella occidentalis]|uniref:Uncharacterized protein LOC113206743 n=1 Tax=Frankliniella occidentalis TaxID=133901 RepID=A0A6J1SDK1_FRAOC|nr:uncharacterized protein LOC113206743 [Frankliniella occidentalis]